MGQTKKIAEELTLDEIIAHLFSGKHDDDYFDNESSKEMEEERLNRVNQIIEKRRQEGDWNY